MEDNQVIKLEHFKYIKIIKTAACNIVQGGSVWRLWFEAIWISESKHKSSIF